MERLEGGRHQKIKAFYEANPFPNYDDFDSVGSLIDKARTRMFAKLLDDQIPYGARVIECGCGTGQLTNFLAIANRTVIGTDLCLNSLKMATAFKQQNDLKRAQFMQMNLFRPCVQARHVRSGDLERRTAPHERSEARLRVDLAAGASRAATS